MEQVQAPENRGRVHQRACEHTFSVKVPVGIVHDEAMQLAQEIGLQLGRGHRVIDEVYNQGQAKQDLIDTLNRNKKTLVDVCEQLNQEVMFSYDHYDTQLKSQS